MDGWEFWANRSMITQTAPACHATSGRAVCPCGWWGRICGGPGWPCCASRCRRPAAGICCSMVAQSPVLPRLPSPAAWHYNGVLGMRRFGLAPRMLCWRTCPTFQHHTGFARGLILMCFIHAHQLYACRSRSFFLCQLTSTHEGPTSPSTFPQMGGGCRSGFVVGTACFLNPFLYLSAQSHVCRTPHSEPSPHHFSLL